MRTKALILLFPFAVFITETASFVPVMQDACAIVAPKTSTCTKTKRESKCQAKKQKSSCTKTEKQDQCQNKNDNNKKTSGNKCTDNPDCTTCPVCYTFIFQPQYAWPEEQILLKKNYSLLTASYIFSYTPNVWKPPNGFFPYS